MKQSCRKASQTSMIKKRLHRMHLKTNNFNEMSMNRKCALVFLLFMLSGMGIAQNPVFQPNQGVCDPHIKIFNNKAYLYAGHDFSIESLKSIL
jgi:DNA polymerase I-like protein with 3'-5' exonuclease and polymerase domains